MEAEQAVDPHVEKQHALYYLFEMHTLSGFGYQTHKHSNCLDECEDENSS